MNEPSTPDSPLDRLLDALRSAPTADELAGEATAVGAMASAIAEAPRGVSPVTARKPLSKPLRRVVGLTAIGVLGVGGLAAAAKGVFVPDNRPAVEKSHDTEGDETTENEGTESETTIVDTTAVDTTGVAATDDESSESTDAADSTAPGDTGPTTSIECADGNHGKTVSSVAHSVPPGPGHGAAVSAAAQSDCGKGDSTSSTSVDTTMPSDTTVAGIAPTNGNGNNGNGHGKPADPGSQGNGHKPSDPGASHGPATTNGG